MLATKISFINEVAELCEALDADVDDVRRGMCSDRRIGDQFLYPGIGYGGSCFPKDVLALIGMARQSNSKGQLLQAVDDVNKRQRLRFVERVDRHFMGHLEGRKIAVWGLAFKPGTDDVREAPALSVIEYLLDKGAQVTVFDPVAMGTTREELGERVDYADDQHQALKNADALIVCTDWNQFKNPDLKQLRETMSQTVVFDGRNLYDAAEMRRAGFTYYSIGRSDTVAPQMSAVKSCA